MAFAANSTNKADYCMDKVDDMHFKSKDVEIEPAVSNDDRLVFYDVEVFPNLFVVCWKFDGDETVYRLINPIVTLNGLPPMSLSRFQRKCQSL